MPKEYSAVPEVPVVPPIDRLGQLAARAASMATDMKSLAAEISDAALEVQAEIEAQHASLEKTRQLQALLKSMSI